MTKTKSEMKEEKAMRKFETKQVMNYIEQCKECSHVSEKLFFDIVESKKRFTTGKSRCLIINSKNLNNVKDILKSNKEITHIFIETGTNEDILKKIIYKIPKNVEFLNIANYLYKLYKYEDMEENERKKLLKKIIVVN